MAIIDEYDQSTQLQPQPQPRYTGPAKPILLSSRKAAPPPTASNPAGNLSVADPLGSVHLLLFDRQYWHILAGLLLLGECVMCALIIRFVSCELSGQWLGRPSQADNHTSGPTTVEKQLT